MRMWVFRLNKLYRSNTRMKMGCQNGEWMTGTTTQSSPLCLVSPLSARMVVWWFICTSGLRANHLNWLRFFGHCVRHFALWRKSAHVSIDRKSRQEGGEAGRKREGPHGYIFHELNSFRSHKQNTRQNLFLTNVDKYRTQQTCIKGDRSGTDMDRGGH